MLNEIILASKSKVRKEILDKNNISSQVEPSNVDEDVVKESLLKEQASPSIISKNLAELKANKVSLKFNDQIVLGADSVIDLDGELISKPKNREEAFGILKKYLNKITDEDLYAYNVYQIEGEGRNLFENIEGDENTIMGLPIKQIKQYLDL